MADSFNTVRGYAAGIVTGISYGLNPLFAKPLMQQGISVEVILFWRYLLSVLMLGAFIAVSGKFRISWKQAFRLLLLGILFTTSSLTLFAAYNYISSGVATTIVFLYPVFVAIIMVFMRVYPSWQVWLSIVLCFIGVMLLCHSDSTEGFKLSGLLFSALSALTYAFFIVIMNRSRRLRTVPSNTISFYALATGSVVFLILMLAKGHSPVEGLLPCCTSGVLADASAGIAADGTLSYALRWLCLAGLAVFPTIVSTSTLATATRLIGATKASVFGVFEPITAIAVGTIAFGEPFTAWIAAGITITLAAITFMAVSK